MYECPEAINVPTDAYQDNWVTWNSLDLLENKPADKPWYVHISI